MKTSRGITLVELVIALAVAAIVLNLAVSAYGSAVQAARASAARSALFATLVRGRTVAALWGADVGLCPSRDGLRCADTDEWHGGWVAYADTNHSDGLDAGDRVLVHQGAVGDGVRIVTSSGRRHLEFQPNGGNAGSNATFTLCDRRGPSRASAIAMGNAGTYREAKPTAAGLERACRAG